MAFNTTVEDLKAMRLRVFSAPSVTREDFSTLLAAGQSAEVAALPEYASLLTDSAIELLINQVDPPKYVQQADADWLIALFQKQKNWTFLTEADVLTNILRYAVSIPASLADFAVQEIEKAIVQGIPALRANRTM